MTFFKENKKDIIKEYYGKSADEIDSDKDFINDIKTYDDGKSGAEVYLINCNDGYFVLKITPPPEYEDSQDEDRINNNLFSQLPEFAKKYCVKCNRSFTINNHIISFWEIAGEGAEKIMLADIGSSEAVVVYTQVSQILLELYNPDSKDTVKDIKNLFNRILGYRITNDGNILTFIKENLKITEENDSFYWHDKMLPNPYHYVKNANKKIHHVFYALCHGDFHGKNVFAFEDGGTIKLKIIDFGLSQPQFPFLYDHAYLEMSELINYEICLEEDPERWNMFFNAIVNINKNNTKTDEKDLGRIRRIKAINNPVYEFIKNKTGFIEPLQILYLIQKVCAGLNFTNKNILPVQREFAYLYSAFQLKKL